MSDTDPGAAPITVTVAMLGVPVLTVSIVPMNYDEANLSDTLQMAIEQYSEAPREAVEAAIGFLRAAAEEADPDQVMKP